MENLLSVLPLLACPVGMGLMMWLMTRANRGQGVESPPAAATEATGADEAGADDRLARLRAELEQVRVRQAAIAAQIHGLSAEERPAAANGRAGSRF